MATRSIPPLLADGGDMTVMRFVASHAFGKISVTLPEGVEAEESDLDQAYSYKLRGGEVPPFGRRFIRADLDIDAENVTSTVEEVLDDVTNRTAGEALFQRDFTRAALGRLELGVDFNVGDLVPVRRWGRILENQLVTAADDLSTPDNPFGVRVHVGGQLIREPAPLAQKNRDIAREIAQERKERLAQVKAVDQKATNAQSTAENAESVADSARSDLDGTEVEAVEEAWNPEGEGWAGAVETLNRNFIEFRAFQIDTNDAIQDRVTAHGLMIQDLQEAKRRALASISRTVISFGARQSDPDAEFIRASIVGDTVYVVALGDWKGTVAVEVISSLSIEGTSFQQPTHFWLTIPDVSFGRSWSQSFTGINIAPVSVMATANIQPGIMREERLPINHFLPDRDRWVTVKSFVAQETSLHTILGEVGWRSTTYNDTYGARLMIGDRELVRDGPRVRVGPIAFWQDGYRKWVLDKRDIQVTEGEEIRLEVWAGATGTDQRTVRDGELRVWWIDDGDE